MDRFKTITVKCVHGDPGNTEWWTNEDWERHAQRVRDLKMTGEYSKEFEISLTFISNPLFDDNHLCEKESWYFELINLSER